MIIFLAEFTVLEEFEPGLALLLSWARQHFALGAVLCIIGCLVGFLAPAH